MRFQSGMKIYKLIKPFRSVSLTDAKRATLRVLRYSSRIRFHVHRNHVPHCDAVTIIIETVRLLLSANLRMSPTGNDPEPFARKRVGYCDSAKGHDRYRENSPRRRCRSGSLASCHLRLSYPACSTGYPKPRVQTWPNPYARIQRSYTPAIGRRRCRRRVSSSPIIFVEWLLVCPISRQVEYSISSGTSSSPSPARHSTPLTLPSPPLHSMCRRGITAIVSRTRSCITFAGDYRRALEGSRTIRRYIDTSQPPSWPVVDARSSCFPDFLPERARHIRANSNGITSGVPAFRAECAPFPETPLWNSWDFPRKNFVTLRGEKVEPSPRRCATIRSA